MRTTLVVCSLLLAVASGQIAKPKDGSVPRSRPQLEACKLLTSVDVQRIQRSALVEAKPSQPKSGDGLVLKQCFFRTQDFAASVSLMLGESGAKNPGAARSFWDATVVKASQAELKPVTPEQMTKSDAKQQRHKPEAVSGLGDQAWWVGDRNTGALYVLRGDRFFRVSVGGKAGEDKKPRARQLAQAILKKWRD